MNKFFSFRISFFILFLFFLSVEAFAQSVRKNTYYAFITGNRQAWLGEIKKLEKLPLVGISDKISLIELYYVYTGFTLAAKDNREASHYIDKAEKLITEVLKSEPRNATAMAFRGSFSGLKIPLNRFKTMQLGSESLRFLNIAYQIDNNNIQALTDRGSAMFFIPRFFGGDKNQAIQHFENALKIIENSGNTAYNWKYMNLMTLLASSYQKTNKMKKAGQLYEKILKIEPGYLRVKNELYPAYKNALKK